MAGRPSRWALAHILVIVNLLSTAVSAYVIYGLHTYIVISNAAFYYSARNARIASAVIATAIPSVRPSVRPSHAGIVSK